MRTILAVTAVLVLAGAGVAASAAYRQYREGAARIVAASSYRPAPMRVNPGEGPLLRPGTFTAALRSCGDGIAGAACRNPPR